MEALQQGEFERAARMLQDLSAAIPETDMPWEVLARAEESRGRLDASVAAIDRRLALEPRNVGALLVKGALLERMGDHRAASSYYSIAIAQQAVDNSCPDHLLELLRHAEQARISLSDRFREYLQDSMARKQSPRFRRAMAMLTGEKELYLQQPSMFYFPELPQRQFYEVEEFDWLEPMLGFLPAMKDELARVEERAGESFAPYVQRVENRPAPNNPLLDDPSWGAYWFWRAGEVVDANARDCPATMEALAHAPMPLIAQRSPMALWSRLTPGTHIEPHHGLLNTRLICHIPIRTAPECFLRVGNETREWAEGIPLIFDDSFEHEARNGGNGVRTVLLFEIWRPEISEAEREELVRLFEAIELYTAE